VVELLAHEFAACRWLHALKEAWSVTGPGIWSRSSSGSALQLQVHSWMLESGGTTRRMNPQRSGGRVS